MKSKPLHIALFAPSEKAYSETFIQAHKLGLSGKVFYYYGRNNSIKLEGHTSLNSKLHALTCKLLQKLKRKPLLYVTQKALLYSLKKNKIDVILVEYGVHAHHLKTVFKASKIPVVVHFHGYDASRYKILEKYNNYKEVFELANGVVAVSQKMKEMLIQIGCEESKITVTPCGPNDAYFSLSPSFKKKSLFAIGRFVDKKAPYYTILAFSKVLEKHPDATLTLAGDGPLFESSKNLASYLKIENKVSFLGVISPSTCQTIMEQSFVFVQHSIRALDGDMEGTPVAVQEASAAGIPVVSTIHAGIPDVVLNNKTGLLVPEHDVEAMANAITSILDNPINAKEMGLAGRKFIKDNFSLKHHLDKVDSSLYKALKL